MPFFWFWNPPTSDLPLVDWLPFRSESWGLLTIVATISTILLVVLYRWRIQKFKIRRPLDPFRVPSRAWWLGWGWWALLPSVVLGVIYWNTFRARFSVDVLPVWGAITAAVVCWAAIILAFQILLWFPGITPGKFLYHPRWPWRLGKHTRRPAVVVPRSSSL